MSIYSGDHTVIKVEQRGWYHQMKSRQLASVVRYLDDQETTTPVWPYQETTKYVAHTNQPIIKK